MKIKLRGKYLILILLIAGTTVFYSCSCSYTDAQTAIPEKVLKNSNDFIVSRVGKEFFNKYIKPDYKDIKEINSKYYMVYSFKMPEKPYVDTKIKFAVDTTGRVVERDNITGLPDCFSSPEKCQFNIDEEQAIKIAKENKFEQGIKEWKVEFKWDPKYDQYVWSILSTLKESKGTFGFRGSGEILLIDPDSGKVIAKNTWRVM
jgi:hypothetical protein